MAEERLGDEVRAALSVRKDLGPDYEDAVVEGFVERLDATITARVQAEVARRAAETGDADGDKDNRFVLAIISLGVGIPLTAIAGGIADLPGLLIAWAGIVGVNVSYGTTRRHRPF